MQNVEGKIAFITGGDSGIGLGIARAFVDAGMSVVITYRSRAHLDSAMQHLRHAGRRVHAVCTDVTDREAMRAAAEETVRIFGKIHILVNNAGVFTASPLMSATFDDWDWCLNVNIDGVFNGIRAFLPHIFAHDEGGQIVATASMIGGLIAGPYWGVYSTSKFAVVGMMEALRTELVDSNIGVSVFCPAGVASNIGESDRNRPPSQPVAWVPDARAQALMRKFNEPFQRIMESSAESHPLMDPDEAGRHVLEGIRNNDLYILSHPEYEQALRERGEAIIASTRRTSAKPTSGRTALAQLACNSIYR